MSAHQAVKPHWTDSLGYQGDDRPKRNQSTEETVESMRRRKRLVDCTLPDGFRLATRRPVQVVTDGLLIYSFVLTFVPLDGTLVRYSHVQRYELTVQDDIQMEWALADFCRDLKEEGVDVEAAARCAPTTHKRLKALRLVSTSKLAGGLSGHGDGVYLGAGSRSARSGGHRTGAALVQ